MMKTHTNTIESGGLSVYFNTGNTKRYVFMCRHRKMHILKEMYTVLCEYESYYDVNQDKESCVFSITSLWIKS